jgi:hypothetical protein
MKRLPQQRWKRSTVVVCGAIIGLAPLVYAEGKPDEDSQSLAARKPRPAPAPAPAPAPGSNVRSTAERRMLKATQTTNQLYLYCTVNRPGQVQRFAVTCPGARHLDVKTADCCVAGDHWQVRVRVWDPKPNLGVTTAPGPIGEFSMPARVFTYGTTHDLNAIIECTYMHGSNTFPAEADVLVESDGSACTVEDLGHADLPTTPAP